MKKDILCIAIGLIIMVSCKPRTSDVPIDPSAPEVTQEVKISSIGVILTPESRELIYNWSKFQLLKSKIEGYSTITKTEAISNAKELSELIIDVSDTIDVKLLDRSDVKTRFNILNNHALRLEDMSTISKITDEEVENEVKKVLKAFSSINEKINTLVKIDQYDIESVASESVNQGFGKVKKRSFLKSTSTISKEKKKSVKRKLLSNTVKKVSKENQLETYKLEKPIKKKTQD